METEVQKIVEKILTDAKEGAKSILLEARKSAETTLEKQKETGRQKALETVSSMLSKAKDEADTIRGMMFSDARRKASWTILSEKERLIESVLDEARSRLAALSKTKRYDSVLEKAIVDAGVALGGGELHVILNKRDSGPRLKLSAMSKAVSEKTGNKTELKLSKERTEALGGAIVKTANGKIVLDNTFEAMVGRRERELRLKITNILFK